MSSCEAEYVAAAAATCQGEWLSNLLADLLGESKKKFKLYVDNQSAIQLCKNPVFHDRSKHIETRYHFIRECVQSVKITVDYVHTGEQLADIMTKALPRPNFQELRAKVGIVNLSSD